MPSLKSLLCVNKSKTEIDLPRYALTTSTISEIALPAVRCVLVSRYESKKYGRSWNFVVIILFKQHDICPPVPIFITIRLSLNPAPKREAC